MHESKYSNITSIFALLGGFYTVIFKILWVFGERINRKFLLSKIARAIYFKQHDKKKSNNK